MSIVGAWKYLIKSPQIKCLAVMAIAQGLTTRILEVSWKTYLHMMCPSPVEYAAFLGDVAAMTGVSTALLMVFSPLLFDLMGWVGVASATPNIMLIGGIPFFIACMVYSFGGGVVGSMLSLKTVVIAGALLHIFARGAKFSLFKPSEEMVYIGLDDESRTKGKAAIDVVGAQSGKSLSSILQQFLLIFVSGGSVAGIIPVLGLTFVTMLGQWKRSIRDLAEHRDPARVHRMSVMASIDDGDVEEAAVSNVPASV
jgi:AAA family ATP:ADP antiporter